MSFYKAVLVLLLPILVKSSVFDNEVFCGRNGKKLKYVFGDALTDNRGNCIGPQGKPYPAEEIAALLPKLDVSGDYFKPRRGGRTLFQDDEEINAKEVARMKNTLMQAYQNTNRIEGFHQTLSRAKREAEENEKETLKEKKSDDKKEDKMDKDDDDKDKDNDDNGKHCEPSSSGSVPSRLCKTEFNTTAPLYGVSLTSGEPVTIVQKFPDLLQQVVFETCQSSECDILRGECVQTYVPYLFLVIPLGPVTLTGQDYVLVESGCTCRPKYSNQKDDPDPTKIVPQF